MPGISDGYTLTLDYSGEKAQRFQAKQQLVLCNGCKRWKPKGVEYHSPRLVETLNGIEALDCKGRKVPRSP